MPEGGVKVPLDTTSARYAAFAAAESEAVAIAGETAEGQRAVLELEVRQAGGQAF